MKVRFLIGYLITMCLISSCSSDEPARIATRQRQAEEVNQTKLLINRTAREGSIPSNYKAQIDSALAGMLLDPESRKVEFTVNPYGGLVCGRVNAKNTFGGYTGYKPFIAIYDSSQKLFRLQIEGGAESSSTQDIVDSFYVNMLEFDCLKGRN